MSRPPSSSAPAAASGHRSRPSASRRGRGVGALLPGYAIDEFVFEPAGYSLNAVRDDRYYTIHVTPEQVGSYVSFETNHVVAGDLVPLVERVIAIFRPRSFDLFTFSPEALAAAAVPGYRVRDHVVEQVTGFHVGFQHLYRPVEGPRAPIELPLKR